MVYGQSQRLIETCGAVAKEGVCLLTKKKKRELKDDFFTSVFSLYSFSFAKFYHCISFGTYGSQNHVPFPINKYKKLKCIVKFIFCSALSTPVHLLPSSSVPYVAGLSASCVSFQGYLTYTCIF